MVPKVTVLIPTAGRPNLIKYVLEGLRAQDFTDFEVLLVLKRNDSKTVELAKHYRRCLNLKVVFQKQHGLINAYNEGICNVSGDLTLFLDDDAIPESNCIREHLLTYGQSNISGVSGDVIPAYLKNGILTPITNSSEIVSLYKEPKILRNFGNKLWNRPLENQENYLAYISKAGYSKKNPNLLHHQMVNSLLCMAANMSVLSSALKNFPIPTSFLKRGIDFEQVIGWSLWKKGYTTVFNPRAKVYHTLHGQSMSRFLDMKNISQAAIEDELVFYYLLPLEEKLSKMHRIVSLLYNSSVHTKKTKENWRYELAVLKGILLGNIIGLKWLVSRKLGGSYIPTNDALLK